MNNDLSKAKTIVLKNLYELQPNPHNPKDHNVGSLMLSINTHGFLHTLGVDTRTNLMSYGHGRLKALKRMKEEKVWAVPSGIVVIDGEWFVPVELHASVDDKHAWSILIADNQLTTSGGWHDLDLGGLLANIADEDHLLQITTFDHDDIDRYLAGTSWENEENYQPNIQPEASQIEYTPEDVLKAREDELERFDFMAEHTISFTCPDCLGTFDIRVSDILVMLNKEKVKVEYEQRPTD